MDNGILGAEGGTISIDKIELTIRDTQEVVELSYGDGRNFVYYSGELEGDTIDPVTGELTLIPYDGDYREVDVSCYIDATSDTRNWSGYAYGTVYQKRET